MKIEYIVVQAGGKGTRMESLTANKPKALVPINNYPMLFHLFRKYPDKKFIIIGDYKIDVLKKYLRIFAKVKYYIIDAERKRGTCAGVKKSIDIIPKDKAFMLIWSDLILSEEFEFPEEENNYIGIAKDFQCRWSYIQDTFLESSTNEFGVAGLFLFKDKNELRDVPEEGELVRWMQQRNKCFKVLELRNTKEYGLISEYQKLKLLRCRPFNQLFIEGNKIIKTGIDEQGKQLALREKAWYKLAIERGFEQVPEIYSYEPFEMERIEGKNIYELTLSYDERKSVLNKIVIALKKLHSLANEATDYYSCENAYFSKTYGRLEKVRDLIPFANCEYIVINGRKCHNVYFYYDRFEEICRECIPAKFVFLHGDCTFSNLMLNEQNEVVFIDPRGYFGYTEMNGAAVYDWAKLFYSIVGNYDQFNLKRFILKILDDEVELTIESNHWEDMETEFFELIKEETDERTVKILHAIIWLSLTTYAWEDYDSICGAFYKGLYHLEEVFK